MSGYLTARLRRSLLATFLASTVFAPLAAGPAHQVAAARAHDTLPSVGTDLYHLDTDIDHHTQGANGQVRLQLYNSPVGIPSFAGWRPREIGLVAPATVGAIAPVNLPFGLHIAPTSAGPTLASFTSEDRVALGVGLASLDGAPPAGAPGRVSANTITYPAVGPATTAVTTTRTDVALRITPSGVDAQVIVHSADEAGPFVFTLTPDPRTHLIQEPNGVIRVTQPITSYGDSDTTAGVPLVTEQPEYIIGVPAATDSSADPVALAHTGPVTLTLAPAHSGPRNVTLTVDPAWLGDPHRHFPVRFDIPISTAESAVHTGLFGTVDSCAPDAPAPQAEVAVGNSGACTYRGQAYFDVSSLQYDTPVVSATLRLYTPAHAGSTDVQVFPNTPPISSTMPVYRPVSWRPPSWNTAPPIAQGAAGIGQSTSDGHWQSWDITDLVRGWIRNGRTNGGLTLVGTGAPLLFASPLGTGTADPSTAPYLDITYAPHASPAPSTLAGLSPHVGRPAVLPRYSDTGATTIYGVSGTFAANCPTLVCTTGQTTAMTTSAIGINTVANAQSGSPPGLGGSYFRVGVTLACTKAPGATWWNSPQADPFNTNIISQILQNAAQRGLIPVIDLVPPKPNACSGSILPLSPDYWQSEAGDFVTTIVKPYYPTGMIYFEIGNEPNFYYSQYDSPTGAYTYGDEFGGAAQGIENVLSTTRAYRVITGGMVQPTANNSCYDLNGNNDDAIAVLAIETAEGSFNPDGYTYHVSSAHLGAAVHPYEYSTPTGQGYWQNFPFYNGSCSNLNDMINQWTSYDFPGLPVLFTEINYNYPSSANCGTSTQCEGSYLVDLFTWLYDHGSNGRYADASSSPLRVMWFRGADADKPLGLYATQNSARTFVPTGVEKNVTINHCASGFGYAGPYVAGTHTMSNDYYYLDQSSCY
jgi:hypothetical protein